MKIKTNENGLVMVEMPDPTRQPLCGVLEEETETTFRLRHVHAVTLFGVNSHDDVEISDATLIARTMTFTKAHVACTWEVTEKPWKAVIDLFRDKQ